MTGLYSVVQSVVGVVGDVAVLVVRHRHPLASRGATVDGPPGRPVGIGREGYGIKVVVLPVPGAADVVHQHGPAVQCVVEHGGQE